MLKVPFLPIVLLVMLASGALAQSDNPQDAQIRQVLTANAWCSFSYNKISGASHTRKVVFRTDGVLLTTGGGETYSSGSAGTFAGQSNSRQSARWKVYQQRVYADPMDGSGFQDLEVTASRNSNGSLILKSDGREYSMCN
jgi:hypothetical protein